jgi:hypothetical protein
VGNVNELSPFVEFFDEQHGHRVVTPVFEACHKLLDIEFLDPPNIAENSNLGIRSERLDRHVLKLPFLTDTGHGEEFLALLRGSGFNRGGFRLLCHDTNSLLLKPIERLTNMVRIVRPS